MKRKNYISKNNFKFSNNFNKRENTMVRMFDKYIGNVDTSDKNNIRLFGDHDQRMMMDGVKNMLEAMIEGRYDIAKKYSILDEDLQALYNKYLSFDHKDLVRERANNPGYTPDSELEEDVQKVIGTFR